MTVDEFEMDPHYSWRKKNETEWYVKASDGGMKVEFSVYDEYIQETFRENFDYFSESVEQELTQRVENDWDEGLLSDEEKSIFLKILGKVIE